MSKKELQVKENTKQQENENTTKQKKENTKKQTIRTIILFSIIVILSVFIILIQIGRSLDRKDKLNTVRISQAGVTLAEFNLLEAVDQELRIDCGSEYNLVVIKDHQIFIKEADCPDQICVNMGALSREYIPIVCSPHQLIIEYVYTED